MAAVILIAAFVTPSGASDASVDIVNHMGPGNPIQVSEQGEIWANSVGILTSLLFSRLCIEMLRLSLALLLKLDPQIGNTYLEYCHPVIWENGPARL